MSKLAKEVVVGDRVKMADGSFKRVTEISKGHFVQPSVTLHYGRNDWSCVLKSDTVHVVAQNV